MKIVSLYLEIKEKCKGCKSCVCLRGFMSVVIMSSVKFTSMITLSDLETGNKSRILYSDARICIVPKYKKGIQNE